MNEWWVGDRKTGFVRLVACEVCGESKRVSVKPLGNLPRKCDDCRKTKYSNTDCLQCGKPIVGRRRRYCAAACRLEAVNERKHDPAKKARAAGLRVLATRGGTISKCVVCGDPVDPRELSRWGYQEVGMNVHESAGSHPSAETVDGPSCKNVLDRQLEK